MPPVSDFKAKMHKIRLSEGMGREGRGGATLPRLEPAVYTWTVCVVWCCGAGVYRRGRDGSDGGQQRQRERRARATERLRGGQWHQQNDRRQPAERRLGRRRRQLRVGHGRHRLSGRHVAVVCTVRPPYSLARFTLTALLYSPPTQHCILT